MGMLAPLFIAKLTSPALLGSYALSKMIMFFFLSMTINAVQTPFIVYANQEKTKTGRINKSFTIQLLFLLISIILFTFLQIIFNEYLKNFANISTLELFYLTLAFIGISFKSFLGNIFLAMNQKIKNSLVEVFFGTSLIILLFLLYLLNQVTLANVFLIYFLSAVLIFLTFVKKINLNNLLPLKFEKKHFQKIFKFAKWQVLGLTAAYFINWGDNIVLRYFVSMEEIGVYNLSYQIFKGLVSLIFILNIYFLPLLSQNTNHTKKLKEYLFQKKPRIFILAVLLIIVIYLFTPLFLKLIYGNTYNDSIIILRILLIATVFVSYNVFYVPLLNAFKRYKFSQLSNVIHIAINLILNIIFIPKIGLTGAALATTLAYVSKTIMLEIYIHKKLNYLSIFKKENRSHLFFKNYKR